MRKEGGKSLWPLTGLNTTGFPNPANGRQPAIKNKVAQINFQIISKACGPALRFSSECGVVSEKTWILIKPGNIPDVHDPFSFSAPPFTGPQGPDSAIKTAFHTTLVEVKGLIYLKIRDSPPLHGMMMAISRPKESFCA
ncbi:MAG TPA: hypothetical protein VI956_06970 [Nitrospirota bacterium]|nr:hypothetical protein [Nitrospirota bacterium]